MTDRELEELFEIAAGLRPDPLQDWADNRDAQRVTNWLAEAAIAVEKSDFVEAWAAFDNAKESAYLIRHTHDFEHELAAMQQRIVAAQQSGG